MGRTHARHRHHHLPPPPPTSSESSSSPATPAAPPPSTCTELKTTKPRGRRPKHLLAVGGSTTSSRSSKGKPAASSNHGRKTSVYRGVTRHRWTGRYEAHIWDKSCRSPRRKGKQVYLGSFDDEEVAARVHDLAAIKYWGSDTALNFPLNTYMEQLEELRAMSREEFLMSLRRRSTGFARGISKFRGVAKHHRKGRWEARIGCVDGCKYLYLGVFSSEEEAAKAYDLAAIKFKGPNAMTNFDVSRYLQPQPKDLQQQEHHLLRQPQPVPIPQAVAPPPPPAAAGAVVDEQLLAPKLEVLVTNEGANGTLSIDGAEGDLIGRDVVQPWALCLEPTGFDPFQAGPIAMSDDVDSSLLDGLYDPTRFEDDVEELFEEMERLVTSDAHRNCGRGGSAVAHVAGGSTGRGDNVLGAGAAGEGSSVSSSSADSNSPIRSPSADGALDS